MKRMGMEDVWKRLVHVRVLYSAHSTRGGELASLILQVQDSKDNHDYALKIYPPVERNNVDPNFFTDVSVMKKFEMHPNVVSCLSAKIGAQIWKELHPSILCKLKDAFQKKSKVQSLSSFSICLYTMGFCLMPLASKGDLSSYLNSSKPKQVQKEFPRRLKFAQDIVNGILCIHSQGYVLQDLKLSNLLIFDDTIKLGDLEECSPLHKMGWKFPRGTTGYLAPERIVHCLPLNFSLDIWSLGIVLFRLFQCEPLEKMDDSTLEEDDLMEVVKCFSFVEHKYRQETWLQWTPTYLPECARKLSERPSGPLIPRLNPNIRVKKAFQKFPESPSVEQVIRLCLQVDPRHRPNIQTLAQIFLLPPLLDVPKERLAPDEAFLFVLIRNFRREQLQERKRIYSIVTKTCPQLQVDLDQQQYMMEKILEEGQMIFVKLSTQEGFPFKKTFVSASLWLACHNCLDMKEVVDTEIWNSWSMKIFPTVLLVLEKLGWNSLL